MNIKARLDKLEKTKNAGNSEINVTITERDPNDPNILIVDGTKMTRAVYMEGIEKQRAAGETIILVGFDLEKV